MLFVVSLLISTEASHLPHVSQVMHVLSTYRLTAAVFTL